MRVPFVVSYSIRPATPSLATGHVLSNGPPDLMWSDPDDVENWAVSPRGAGWLFGAAVTNEVSGRIRLHSVPQGLTDAP